MIGLCCAAAADGGMACWVIQIQGSAGAHACYAFGQQLGDWQGVPLAYPIQESGEGSTSFGLAVHRWGSSLLGSSSRPTLEQ